MPEVTEQQKIDWNEVQRTMEENVSRLREALAFAGSYERLPMLLESSHLVPGADWLRILGEEWDGFDNIGLYADELVDAIFSHYFGESSTIDLMMDDAERDAFAQLPDVLTIYRGCYAANKWGFSWSLDRDIAEDFPFLNRYDNEGRPLLVKATIHKSKVAALKLGREEAEIVTFQRPKCVSISTARKPADTTALLAHADAMQMHDAVEVAA